MCEWQLRVLAPAKGRSGVVCTCTSTLGVKSVDIIVLMKEHPKSEQFGTRNLLKCCCASGLPHRIHLDLRYP